MTPVPITREGAQEAYHEHKQKRSDELEVHFALQERLEETDDAAALARARQWDDYKDTHKRGEGNRYNRS